MLQLNTTSMYPKSNLSSLCLTMQWIWQVQKCTLVLKEIALFVPPTSQTLHHKHGCQVKLTQPLDWILATIPKLCLE